MSTTVRPPRRRSVALALATAAVAATLVGCGSASGGPSGSGAAPVIDGGSELSGAVSSKIMNIPFTDQSGKRVRLSDYAGKTIVLEDILTLCQEHCPIDTATFVQTAEQYAASAPDPDSVVFLSITVDPARDTPAQLAAYRAQYVGAASHLPQWHLLTASPADLRMLWHYFHVYVQKVGEGRGDGVIRNWRTGQRLTYDVDHGDDIYFIDRSGKERYVLDGQPALHGATIPPKMKRFMNRQGQHNTAHGVWTAGEALKVLAWVTGRPS